MVQHLSIEEDEEFDESACPCCGGRMRLVMGVVRNESGDIAQYFLYLVDGSSDHLIHVDLIVGNISIYGNPMERFAVSLQHVLNTDNYQFIDAVGRPFGFKRNRSCVIPDYRQLAEEFSSYCIFLTTFICRNDSRANGS